MSTPSMAENAAIINSMDVGVVSAMTYAKSLTSGSTPYSAIYLLSYSPSAVLKYLCQDSVYTTPTFY